MLDSIEVFYVDGDSAACDGGCGALGHPRVYLAIERSGRAICPYCGRVFVRDAARAGESETLTASEAGGLAPDAEATQY
jgi:uncharacterized Zn-finger protein